MFIFKDIRCTEWQDSLLKSGNNTANIYAKKLHFIHTVNGDGSKTAKIIKSTINHTNIAWTSMLVWLVVPFCDFCGLKTYITYKVCRTVELYQAMSIHLAQQHSHCHAKHGVPRPSLTRGSATASRSRDHKPVLLAYLCVYDDEHHRRWCGFSVILSPLYHVKT